MVMPQPEEEETKDAAGGVEAKAPTALQNSKDRTVKTTDDNMSEKELIYISCPDCMRNQSTD
jgi:hypothetical protein